MSGANKEISSAALTNILLQRGDMIQLAAAQSNGGQEQGGGSDSTEPSSPFKGEGGDQKSKTPSSGGQSSTGSAAKSAAPSAESGSSSDSTSSSSDSGGSHIKHHTKSHSEKTSYPKDVGALNKKGNALYLSGDYTGAIQYYDKVLAIDPKNVAALTNKGVALDNLGDPTQAIQYYDKVLAIDPKNVAALNDKGAALGKLGRNEEAIAIFDKVLGLEANTGVSYNQNKAGSNSIRYTQNVQYSTNVLKLKFDYISLVNTIPSKNLYMYEEPSRAYYISLSKESESIIIAETNKGIALYNIERYQEAIANFDRVLVIVPDYVSSLYYKGLCLEKIGQVNEAVVFKDKAAKVDPKYKGGFIKIIATQSPLEQLFKTP
jgi:tetratricopeptide (TPR) repeat protein